jgi:5-methylthioadenosine/S-adenosylhomocysteine deaminase
MPELLVTGGIVITLDTSRRVIRDGAAAVRDDRVVAVGKAAELEPRFPAAERLDARGCAVLPGFVDTHQHNTQMLARGIADDVSFRTWLYERIFPFDALLSEEDVYWGTLLDGIEQIRSGITCFTDPGGPHPEAVARAIQEVGTRGFIAFHTMDQAVSGHPIPETIRSGVKAAVERTGEVYETWHGKADGRIMVSASVRNIVDATPALMEAMAEFATSRRTIVQMHTAVCDEHNAWMVARHGKTPVAYLASLGLDSDRWLFPHGARVDDEEVAWMARVGARVSHCPGPSMHGAYGSISRGKIPEMLAAGVRVGLGCDAPANNNKIDMFQELYLVATGHKEARTDPSIITPEQALEMATIGGAAALDLQAEVGSLEPGKKADVVLVELNRSGLVPIHDFSLVPNLVYCGSKHDVRTVIVNGAVVMRDRQITTVDEAEVLRQAQQRAERVVREAGVTPPPRWRFE